MDARSDPLSGPEEGNDLEIGSADLPLTPMAPTSEADEPGAPAELIARTGKARGAARSAVESGPDGGVLIRLSRRTAVAAGILGLLIVLITATGLAWPGWFATTTGLVVGFALIIGCAVTAALLLRKSGVWTSLSTRTVLESEGVLAVVGAPRPLHGSGASVMRRRAPAQVVPIRSAGPPWANGGVLLVHGRVDGKLLQDGQEVRARWYVSRGPYLLERTDDGVQFVAERSTLATW